MTNITTGMPRPKALLPWLKQDCCFLPRHGLSYEAVKRLFGDTQHIEVAWWAFAIIGGSIMVDFSRARALNRVARETSSEALEADALHFQLRHVEFSGGASRARRGVAGLSPG